MKDWWYVRVGASRLVRVRVSVEITRSTLNVEKTSKPNTNIAATALFVIQLFLP